MKRIALLSSLFPGQSSTVWGTVRYLKPEAIVIGKRISNQKAPLPVDILPGTAGVPANLTLSIDINGTETRPTLEYIDTSNIIVNLTAVTYQSGKASNLQESFETETGTVFTTKADLVVCL